MSLSDELWSPDAPCYLADLARAKVTGDPHWNALHETWRTRFHQVHFEHYGTTVAAAVAEVTPERPPYDYRGQEPVTRRGRKNAEDAKASSTAPNAPPSQEDGTKSRAAPRREPAWTYWREVLVAFPPDADRALNDELCQLANLYLRASNFTDPEDAAYCHRLLRPALTECVSYYDCLDTTPTPPGGPSGSPPGRIEPDPRISSLREQREATEAIYKRCAERRTITQYTVGMLLGLLTLPLLLALNVLAFFLFNLTSEVNERLPSLVETSVHVGTVLGAVGAVSSVLLRINSPRVDLDVESTRHGWHVWLNPVMQRGVARVVIGIVFGGVAAWFVLAGVLVPDAAALDLDDAESTILMVGVLAYISGFSERFIPDLIIRSGRSSAS